MTNTYMRVRGTVAFTGEWFVKVEEDVFLPEHAIAQLVDGASFIEPETVLTDHVFQATSEPILYCDEDGKPLPVQPGSSTAQEPPFAWQVGDRISPKWDDGVGRVDELRGYNADGHAILGVRWWSDPRDDTPDIENPILECIDDGGYHRTSNPTTAKSGS